ncbi:MAG: hypothetical protein MRK02_12960 [Candidatus Scalindua sp.]|nr:hypothetical protein [Candidatus Scalindua sp.]
MTALFEIVSKLDVARRQLRIAIRLFFERKDCIAIHTLAASAHDVLFPILKKNNPSAAFNVLLHPDTPYIRPEKRTY